MSSHACVYSQVRLDQVMPSPIASKPEETLEHQRVKMDRFLVWTEVFVISDNFKLFDNSSSSMTVSATIRCRWFSCSVSARYSETWR